MSLKHACAFIMSVVLSFFTDEILNSCVQNQSTACCGLQFIAWFDALSHQKCESFWGGVPDSDGGAYSAPPIPPCWRGTPPLQTNRLPPPPIALFLDPPLPASSKFFFLFAAFWAILSHLIRCFMSLDYANAMNFPLPLHTYA